MSESGRRVEIDSRVTSRSSTGAKWVAVRLSTTAGRKFAINVAALTALLACFAVMSDRFLTMANMTNVLRQTAPVVIVAVAVTLLMVSRQLDLSVGSILAVSGVVAALLSQELPLTMAFVLGTLAGASFGMLNATLVLGIGINGVIATLGTLYIARGTALLLSGGTAVYQVPSGYSYLGVESWLNVPIPIWFMLIAVAVFATIERFTLLGRYAIASGSNRQAAVLSGIPVNRTQAILYTMVGVAAGFAGVLVSSRLNAGLPNAGIGFEFEVIVATILGGTSLMGGEGTVKGAVLGALIVGVLGNGLNLLGIQSFWQTVAQGVVLVLAVGLDAAMRPSDKRNRFIWAIPRGLVRRTSGER